MKTTRLQVRLRDVEPRVIRVLDVPATATLSELHDLLQVAMGWSDSHLHQFVTDDAVYGVPSREDGYAEQLDESTVSLRHLPSRFVYRYDFGDGWQHDVEVLGPGRDRPACVFGDGVCPPEDCGGPPGFEHLLEVLADPGHAEHDQLRRWVGGHLTDFDQEIADDLVRRMVGEVPSSVRLVLDLVGEGVHLTPGGRLPRALVRAVQDQRPDWYPLDRPASVEEDLYPLAVLHDLLRDVGLLRLSKGVLSRTRAASDELQTVRRLRSVFAGDEFDSVLATRSVALLAARGPQLTEDLAASVLPLLGRGWMRGDRPLTDDDTRTSLRALSSTLQALDLVERDGNRWRAGPSACSLLSRATALAHLWSPAAGGRVAQPR